MSDKIKKFVATKAALNADPPQSGCASEGECRNEEDGEKGAHLKRLSQGRRPQADVAVRQGSAYRKIRRGPRELAQREKVPPRKVIGRRIRLLKVARSW